MSQCYIVFSESFCKILIMVLDRLIISNFITCIIILNYFNRRPAFSKFDNNWHFFDDEDYLVLQGNFHHSIMKDSLNTE